MEELLIIILQFLGECLLEILCALPSDVFRRSPSLSGRGPQWPNHLAWLIGGLLLGGASLLIFPATLIHHPLLRILNLIVAPLLAGFCASMLNWLRWHISPDIQRHAPFLRAFYFCLGLTAIRFIFADRS